MADRINKRDVREIFTSFCEAASRAGFDTMGWTLIHPGMKGDVYRVVAVQEWRDGDVVSRAHDDTPFPSHLDATNRETYYRIQAWIQCLTAIRNNNAENGSN